MIEISNITDRQSLEIWLNDLPFDQAENRRIAVNIAHRAAMRVLPLHWKWVGSSKIAHRHDLTALPILRCSLMAGVACAMPTPLIMGAVSAATAATDAAYPSADATDDAAADAAVDAAADAADAARATDADAAADAAYATYTPSYPTDDATNAAYTAIRSDCEMLMGGDVRLDQTPLWPDENPLTDVWRTIRDTLPEGYEFWRNWYQNVLNGVPPNWDMLTEIALIKPEDWDKTADHVNGLIAGIVKKYQ